MKVENITLFFGKMQDREKFTDFVKQSHPDFQKSARIFSEESFRLAPYNFENLSMHERVEASLEAFFDYRIDENKSEPIVVYDAFFYLDEGKDLSEIFTKMRETKRPVFVFMPENVEYKIEFIDEPVDDDARVDTSEEISEFKDKDELAKAIPYVAFKQWGANYMEHLSEQGKAGVYEAWRKIKLVDLQSLSDACLKAIPRCWFFDWLHVHYMGMPTKEAETFLEDVIKRFPEKNNPYDFRRG